MLSENGFRSANDPSIPSVPGDPFPDTTGREGRNDDSESELTMVFEGPFFDLLHPFFNLLHPFLPKTGSGTGSVL